MSIRRKGMTTRGRRVVFLTALLAASTGSAVAQGARPEQAPCASGQLCTSSGADVAALKPLVQQYVGSYLASKGIKGAAVGVSWNGRRTYFGYGFSDTQGQAPYDPSTIVEIGSITKVFTTALFEEAVAEGKLQLTGELRTYASALGLSSLTWCAGLKNLQQLADFSSGMPRFPQNVTLPAPDIKTYTVADFLSWVSAWVPSDAKANNRAKCEANDGYLYSNASIGLLGILLADVYHKTWPALIDQRITAPLGMSSTAVNVPQDQRYRLAQGYDPDNNPAPPWPVFAWYAAGALRSDAADMLSFGEAALGNSSVDGIPSRTPGVGALEAAISLATVPVYNVTTNGNTFGQGLAWEELIPTSSSQYPVYVKNGGTSGFSTAIVVNKHKDLAVFIAFPMDETNAQGIGVSLVRAIGSGN